MVHYRSEDEIDLIRESSLLVAKKLTEISNLIKPGVTTLQLDKIENLRSLLKIMGDYLI